MNVAEPRVRTLLTRYLGRYGEPPPRDVARAVERVWLELEPDAAAAPARRPLGPTVRPTPRWQLAAVAAMGLIVFAWAVFLRHEHSSSPPHAVVESVDGVLYEIVRGDARAIRVGAGLDFGHTVRANGGAGAMLVLADGSRVEMRSQSELSLERADDGLRIRLINGGIIVNAAKQRGGHLYVQTKDVTVSVVGTVFFVNAEEAGSRVAVIEGEVRVQQGATERSLRPGELVSTHPKPDTFAVQKEIGWSREAAAYLALLHQSLAQSMAARQPPSLSSSVSDRPQFEEAAIRPCPEDFRAPEGARGGGSNSLRITRGRLDALCVTVATLIRTAYPPLGNNSPFAGLADVPARFDMTQGLGREDGTRVRGGPDWVRSEKYTIAAVADGGVDPITLRGPMLLALLERRFQLKAHIEVEQIPVLALTVSKSGLRIKPADRGDCVQGGWFPGGSERRRRLDALRSGAKPECGPLFLLDGPNVVHVGGGVSMRTFARMLTLSSVLTGGRLILDRTDISETTIFNLFLEYGRDESAPGPGAELPPIEPSDIPRAPGISAALEELGLRLDQAEGPREFIVIDQIERPSPN